METYSDIDWSFQRGAEVNELEELKTVQLILSFVFIAAILAMAATLWRYL